MRDYTEEAQKEWIEDERNQRLRLLIQELDPKIQAFRSQILEEAGEWADGDIITKDHILERVAEQLKP